MHNAVRVPRLCRLFAASLALAVAGLAAPAADVRAAPDDFRTRVLDAMKRAAVFMVERVSTEGGYVWAYLPDFSRRWGELEARETMIWIQPPGTPAMGHVFLDAYHATGDEYYYRAAERAAAALMRAQLPSGGWNYVADLAGEQSLQQWYDTVGRNAWRLEEFQHHWRNGTFDDAGTAESAKLLLRLFLEKRDPKHEAALDRAIAFVLDSQYPNGGWPQRFPLKNEFSRGGLPDYTSFITFNDDVAGENIDFLLLCHQALGGPRLLDATRRGMDAFLAMQRPAPQAGWALQYTLDLEPSGARTYEPKALVTHTTAANVDLLIKFYKLTGDTKYLARLPEAIDWLEAVALPAGVAPEGRTHPTFVEVGTNRPLYVHRTGSNAFNGRYYADGNPRNTIGHYSSFRRIDTAGLRRRYEEARALSPAMLARESPLAPGAARRPLPPFFAGADAGPAPGAEEVVASLDGEGRWLVPLGINSHPYRGDGSAAAAQGDYSKAMVGDETDTSPYPDPEIRGISTAAFIRNMSVLIRWLGDAGPGRAGRGFEGQRRADRGDGTYRNPIVAGDHPDPSILKDGSDYYMTFSSFDAYPGLVVWHSKDLVNWQPVVAALRKNVGSVWAPDLVKHGGRYYIYFPGIAARRSNYVIWADDISGPWSDPIDLGIGRIDPGHAVGPDGTRYLFLSAGYRVELSPDGLSVAGKERKVYDGWRYPDDWIVEAFAQEGPKILKRGEYYHMVLAEGGTAGPPTGHMVVSARSMSIDGPWENSPYNPIVRTNSASERWWSKGHGTLVEGPDGTWFIVYHAYENGFQTLGRQTLLEPIEWTDDGWFRRAGADPARPIPKPAASDAPHGFPFSDDFSSDRMGIQWAFYKGTDADRARYRYEDKALVLQAKGTSPSDCSPLSFVTGDHAYEVQVEIDADPGATAGLLLFYSSRLYAGLGYSASNFLMHSYGLDRPQVKPAGVGRALHVRIRNDRHIVTIHYSTDGANWTRYDRGMELSGYHHNVAYEFLSLRPALYAAGTGTVRFRNFQYRALP